MYTHSMYTSEINIDFLSHRNTGKGAEKEGENNNM